MKTWQKTWVAAQRRETVNTLVEQCQDIRYNPETRRWFRLDGVEMDWLQSKAEIYNRISHVLNNRLRHGIGSEHIVNEHRRQVEKDPRFRKMPEPGAIIPAFVKCTGPGCRTDHSASATGVERQVPRSSPKFDTF